MKRRRTKAGRMRAMIEGVKRDVRAGRRVTLITFTEESMKTFARYFTADELSLISFSVPGMLFARRAANGKRK